MVAFQSWDVNKWFDRLLSAALYYSQVNKSLTLLLIPCHAPKLTTVANLLLCIIISIRYSSNHNVKIIGPLAVNQPHQPRRHLVTAPTAAAVATVGGQNTSKSLAGGSQSQETQEMGETWQGSGALLSEAYMVRALSEQ